MEDFLGPFVFGAGAVLDGHLCSGRGGGTLEAICKPFVYSRLGEALEGRAVDFAQDARVLGVAVDGV